MTQTPSPIFKKTGITDKYGTSIVSIMFPSFPENNQGHEAGWTHEQVHLISNEISERLHKSGISGKLKVSTQSNVGYRSGKWTPIGSKVSVYNYVDSDGGELPDFYKTFVIYAEQTNVKSGGLNKNNSCFYDSLKELIGDDIPWTTDRGMKKKLGLKPFDLVPMSSMEYIQSKIPKYQLIISGDDSFIGTGNSAQKVKISLSNKHYSAIQNKAKDVRGTAKTQKRPLIYSLYKTNDSSEYAKCFDGTERFWMSKESFNDHFTKPRTSKYTLIEKTEGKKFKESYNNFLLKADMYKKESNGLIDFYMTGTELKTLMTYFNETTKNLEIDHIDHNEAEWIQQASTGALIWGEKGYKGKVYKYDVVSMYPSIQRDHRTMFPIKEGKFSALSEEEFSKLTYFSYGIYRARISGESVLFRKNHSNYYTHFDLNSAKKLGLTITLLPGVNALLYDASCRISGRDLFGKYIDTFFEFKKKGMPEAKKMINMLWGALSKTKTQTFVIGLTQEFVVQENKSIHEISPFGNDRIKLELVSTESYFEYQFARIKPFLLSRGRLLMCESLLPHINSLVRLHTDGFMLTKKVDTFRPLTIGSDIGNLMYEGKDNVHIIHVNKFVQK